MSTTSLAITKKEKKETQEKESAVGSMEEDIRVCNKVISVTLEDNYGGDVSTTCQDDNTVMGGDDKRSMSTCMNDEDCMMGKVLLIQGGQQEHFVILSSIYKD